MRSSTTSRRLGRSHRTLLNVHSLETRCVPAGLIKADLSLAGVLTITGDDSANNFILTITDTGASIDPDGNNKVNTKNVDDIENLSGKVKSIRVDLKGGSDAVSIPSNLAFSVSGPVSFMLGDGNNTLDMTTDKTITLGSLIVTGGDGSDAVTVQGGINQASKVIGPAIFTYANGGSTTALGDLEFGSLLKLTAGDGVGNPNDFAATTVRAKATIVDLGNSYPGIASFDDSAVGTTLVRGQSIAAVLTGTSVTGNLTVLGGYDAALTLDAATITGNVLLRSLTSTFTATGDATTVTGNLTVIGLTQTSTSFESATLSEFKGNVTVIGGWYNDEFTTNGQFRASKNVTLNLAGGDNTVTLGEESSATSIGGALTIRGGAGRDDININRLSVAGAVLIQTFAGVDRLSIETNSSFTTKFTADMGTGDDTISVAQSELGDVGEVLFSGPVSIKAGLGDDTLLLGKAIALGGDNDSRVRFSAAVNVIDGGLGFDTFVQLNSEIVGVPVSPIGFNP